MRKIYLLIFAICIAIGNLFAQRSNNESGVITCTEFNITRPLRDIFAENPVDENKIYEKEESEDRENRKPQKFRFSVKDGLEYGNDPKVIQNEMGNVPGRAPITNWAGQTASGFRPYDPSGSSGINHYVQMINSTTFKVYNKTTGAVLLTATLGNLWSPATPNSGDPIVLYDKAADRWFLAQFGTTGNKMYIAISTTGDPTGTYYTYTFTSPAFPDYLKFSTWVDGYYMTSNQAQKVFCFDRTAMLAGNAGSRAVYTSFSPPQGSGFFCPLPGDASDGALPPFGTPCPILSYSDNAWGASYSDAVNIYQMSVDWIPVTPTSTITLAAVVPTASFDASYDPSWNDVSQPGTAQKLDGIGGVCMYRSQWKTWNGYNTIVLNWGVKISSTQRSIKWCELRQNQSNNAWSLYQEGIYTPDAATRWMGSIAMDNNGSIGLCYMKSDATSIYPGLYYTGRRACDPLGTMPIVETTVVTGTGSQTTSNRVGDYSHLALDPDGVTFWHTSEYMGGSTGGSAARTQIFSFQMPVCENTAIVSIAQTGGTNPQCPGASATFTATPVNGGVTPVYQWQVNGSNVGTNSDTYATSSLTNGQIVTCIMTSSISGVLGNPATSNAITMTVNPAVTPSVSIAITTGANPTCSGSALTFTATPVNGGSTPSYQWKVDGVNAGTNNVSFSTGTLTNGQVVSCVITSNAPCASISTATSNNITMTVSQSLTQSVSIAQTAGTNPACAGASATFTATITGGNSPVIQWKVNGTNAGTNSTTFTTTSLTNAQTVSCTVSSSSSCTSVVSGNLGTGTGTNATTSDLAAAYPTYYGNGRQQYLVLASELTALGLTAGNITSLGFNVAGTTGNPATLNGYTIKMASSAAVSLTTTFLTPVFTTVYGPTNYSPVLNSINTHTFSTPFVWDGSSNVLIDICFSNQVVGSVSYQTYQTSTAFVSTAYYQADGSVGAGACTQTSATATGSVRPNMIFTRSSNAVVSNSNVITMVINPSSPPSVSIALTSGTNPTCSGNLLVFTATASNGGSTPVYQWKVDGVNAGLNSNTFSTSTLTNGQVVSCDLTATGSCASPNTASSNGITVLVNSVANPTVSISQTSGTNPLCENTSVTFTATVINGNNPSYQWKIDGVNVGTNNSAFTTSTLINGQAVSCDIASFSSCTQDVTNTLGAGTGTNVTNTSLSAAYPTYWGNGRQQYLIKASELTALGLSAGNITSLGFNVAGTTGNPSTLNGYTIKIAQTASTVMTTTFLTPVFTTVFGPVNYTPILNSINTHPFISPFSWDGTSNIVVDICFSNQVVGITAYQTYQTTSSFVSTAYYQADGATGAGACTKTTGSGTGSVRPNMIFTINSGALLNASSNVLTMLVNPQVAPSVSISITSGSNPECDGASATFTATSLNGGSSPSYQWKIGGVNVGTNSATYTTSSLINGDVVTCEMTSNADCVSGNPAVSNSIIMTVNPNVTASVSISANPGSTVCDGASVTFTAIAVNGGPAPSYQWKLGATNVGTNSPNYTTTTLSSGNSITCEVTSNAFCAIGGPVASNTIVMTVNPNVAASVSISANPGNIICSGTSVTFTATPTNGGTTPSYQWKVGATNVGTNSPTYTSVSLANGNSVTCVMTSNAGCVTGSPATSNAIVMTVNPNVAASVSLSASPGNTICSGASVTFTAAPTNGGTTPSYQWKIGAANVGTNSSTYTNASLATGNSITCVMTSNATCATGSPATSNAIVMTVNPNVTASVSISASTGTTICSGTSVTFTATPTNGGTTPSYQWKRGATNVGTNSPTYTTTTLANGNSITCVMTSNAPCVSGSPATSNAIVMTVNANVAASVSISANPGNTICAGTSVTFTATPTNGGTTPGYQWKIGTTNVGTNSPTYTNAALANANSITCVMTSNATCVSGSPATSNAIVMTVNSNVTASVSISANPGNTICSGTSVTFTATPTNGGTTPSYQWKRGTTNVGTNSPTYTTTTLANGNSITCVMTSNAPCVSGSPATSNAIVMTVNPNVAASVSISANPGNTICSGTSVTFTAAPTNGGATPSYQWKIGASNVGTNSATYTNAALSSGNSVTCVMTSNATCATGSPATSNAIVLTVNPNLTASVSISANPGNTICLGTGVTFTATPSNGGATPIYQWKIGASNVGTNSPTYTNASLANGNSVTCVMTSGATCATGSPAISNAIVMTVNPNLTASVNINANSGNTICDGTSVTFTATPSNGGATPSYQWKIDAVNVGTNSSTYTNTALINGNSITCEMVSNAGCINGSPATSNAINMTVIPNVAASVSISANPGSTICDGTSVTFTATPSNG